MARYAFSDIHGRYDLLKQILEFAKEDDELYFLGDAADRGPEPWKCITALLSDKRVIWIKGNHDEFLLSLPMIYELGTSLGGGGLWLSNDGSSTIEECLEHLRTKDEITSFCKKIRDLPERVDITREDSKNIILTHAGLDPDLSDEDYRAWYGRREKRYLWDRHHLHSAWRGGDDTYVVHGHTPVPFLSRMGIEEEEEYIRNPQIKIYAEGHKVDLDIGAVWSDTAALFNLDTFEVKYFKEVK